MYYNLLCRAIAYKKGNENVLLGSGDADINKNMRNVKEKRRLTIESMHGIEGFGFDS